MGNSRLCHGLVSSVRSACSASWQIETAGCNLRSAAQQTLYQHYTLAISFGNLRQGAFWKSVSVMDWISGTHCLWGGAYLANMRTALHLMACYAKVTRLRGVALVYS
jgi:hypothetical protein